MENSGHLAKYIPEMQKIKPNPSKSGKQEKLGKPEKVAKSEFKLGVATKKI